MAGLTSNVKQVARLSLAGRALAALAAFALSMGAAWFVLSATQANVSPGALAAGAAGSAAAAALGCVAANRGRTERVAYLGAGIAVAVAAAVLNGPFLEGGAQFVNAALMRLGERTQVYAMPYQTGGDASTIVFCLLAGAAVGLAASALCQRGIAVPAVAACALALAGVVSGWVPAGWWALPLALGIVGCACVRSVLSNRAAPRASYPWVLACALLAFVLAGAGALAAVRGESADTSAAQDALAGAAWNMEYGGASFAMPEGKLAGLGPLAASDQVAMEVEVDEPTYEYLRGFVGARYSDDTWAPLAAEDVMANRDLLYWLDADGFSQASQIADAAQLSGYEDVAYSTLKETLRTVRKPYAYLPYGYGDGSPAHATTDMAQMHLDAQQAQELSFDAGLVRKAYLLQDAVADVQERAAAGGADASASAASAASSGATSSAATASSGASDVQTGVGSAEWAGQMRTYLDDDSAYWSFTRSEYLQIPDDAAKTFEELFGPPTELTCEQAKIQVLALLEDTVSYDPESPANPTDSSFVDHFLTELKTGYSVHYATAATLLMRYYGVPARYVEGYVLDTAALDAQKADAAGASGASAGAQGASASASAKSADAGDGAQEAPFAGSYTLTERQAHAWVEYYLDGVGWVPFDVTPQWRDANFYEMTDKTEQVEESQNWSVGAAQRDKVWTPPETDQEEEEEQPAIPDLLDGAHFGWLSWPWVLVGFLLTLLAAFIVRDILLRSRLKRFLARGADPFAPARSTGPSASSRSTSPSAPVRGADPSAFARGADPSASARSADPSESARGADPSVPVRELVCDLFSYLVLLARTCGKVPLANEPYAAQASLLEDAGLCTADEFARAAAANDRALFAKRAPTPRDVEAVMSCIASLHSSLKRQTSPQDRFWQRHVQCLW